MTTFQIYLHNIWKPDHLTTMWSKNSQTVGFLLWEWAGRSHDNKEREFEGQTEGMNRTTQKS